MFGKHAGCVGLLALVLASACAVSCSRSPRLDAPHFVAPDAELVRFGETIRGVTRISAENGDPSTAQREILLEREPEAAELLDYVESHPEDLAARQDLSSTLVEKGFYWSAYGLLEDLDARRPGMKDVSLGLASVWYAWGEYDLALESAQVAASDWPSAESYALLGRIRLQRKEFQDAVEAFLRAEELEPTDPLAVMGAGVAFLALKEWSEAHMYLERAVRLNPEMSEARRALEIARVGLDGDFSP